MRRLLLLLLAGSAWPLWAAPALESRLAPSRPWLGQQVHYEIRFYRDSHLQQGDFAPLEIADALLVHLGESEPVPVRRDGREQELVRDRWLLFPLRAGTLVVPPPAVSGQDLFVKGSPARLEVRAPPPEAGRPWVVAGSLVLEEHWSGDPEALVAGKWVTRTLRIRATDQTAALLPAPEPGEAPGLELQPLPERRRQWLEKGRLVAEAVFPFRYLARAPASGTLPAVRIGWWDPAAERWRVEVLEGRPYRVAPAAAADEGGEPADAPPRPDPEKAAEGGVAPAWPESARAWASALILLLFLAVPIALVLHRFRRRPGGRLDAEVRLLLACLRRDAAGAARLLLARRVAAGWPRDEAALAAWRRLEGHRFGGRGEDAAEVLGLRGWWWLRRLLAGAPRRGREPGKAALPPLWPGGGPASGSGG